MKHLSFFLLWFLLALSTQAQQNKTPQIFNQLKYRFVGPEGNRAIAIAGVNGDNNIAYIGAASGGLWKTDDAGITWKPIFDEQDVSSVSALAIAPTDPNQVWAGTGETFLIRPAHSVGNGIYKSTDAGKTWKNMGLEKTARIGRIVVHPQNPDIVYVAALGHTYAPQQERGVYRTKDGGKSWERVFFLDENTGCADLALDPQNPDILYAGMWQISIKTWGLNSGGASSGLYRSKDGGNTWEALNKKGLPFGKDTPVGKVAVALCHNKPNVVYTLFEGSSPALYRSEDSGESWKLMSNDHSMAERAPYYTRIAVSPDNPDEIYTICVKILRSYDGGKTFDKRFGYQGGGDNHDLWFDVKNPNRYMVAHDGCANITLNRGKSFQNVVLPIAQMYHVAVDNRVPYFLYGNRQDGWSYRGPSNSKDGGSIPLGLWHGVGGCESGFAKPDPFDENIVWSGCYDGGLDRYDLRTNLAQDVRVFPEAGYGWNAAEMRFRWHWNFPLSFSPHTKHRVYVGSQFVHKTDDNGQSWQIISPDLTTNDKTHQQRSGGVATDNLMTFDGCTLFAIEESPLQKDLIWVGSNDGQVHLTKDGGKNWENLTKNINMPAWGTVANIEPSRYEVGTAYISVDFHQLGNFDPYIFKTSDFGKTWTLISGGIPKSILSFIHVVREDPKMKGMLYAGTDNGIYITKDDGKTWFRLQNNLPPAPVYWLAIQENFDDLVVSTYGRGYYILDDISAVRNAVVSVPTDNSTPLSVSSQTTLFPIRKAYRFHEVEGIKEDFRSMNIGRNPPYGASINYYLKDSTTNEVKIQILKDNQVIRTLEGRAMEGKKQAGINRVWWDLRYDPVLSPQLRTLPPDKPWVELNKDGWRPLVTWDLDLDAGKQGPRVAPSQYTVKLIVGNQEYTQTLEVLKDPNAQGSQAEIEEQVKFCLELRNATNTTVSMINRLEWIRKELKDIIKDLKDKKLIAAAQNLETKATNIVAQLYDIHLTGAREDAFRNPVQLYERLLSLASDIGSSGLDFKPTSQQREAYAGFDGKLKKVQSEFKTVIEKDIPDFNNQLKKINKPLKINIERPDKEGK
jgi:photosystem II stability/assembly factor-like uncharacterized protein